MKHIMMIMLMLVCIISSTHIVSGQGAGAQVARIGTDPFVAVSRPIRQVRSTGYLISYSSGSMYGTSPPQPRLIRAQKSHSDFVSMVDRQKAEPSIENFIIDKAQPIEGGQPKSSLFIGVFEKKESTSMVYLKMIVDWLLQSTLIETFMLVSYRLTRFSRLMVHLKRVGLRLLRQRTRHVQNSFNFEDTKKCFEDPSAAQTRFQDNVVVAQNDESPMQTGCLSMEDLSLQSSQIVLDWYTKTTLITQMFILPEQMDSQNLDIQLLDLWSVYRKTQNILNPFIQVQSSLTNFIQKFRQAALPEQQELWLKMLSFKTLAINYIIMHDFFVHNFVSTSYFDMSLFSLHLSHIPVQKIMVDVSFAKWLVEHIEAMIHDNDDAELQLKLKKRLLAPQHKDLPKTSLTKTLFAKAEHTTATLGSFDQAGQDVVHSVFNQDLFLQIVNGVNAGIRITSSMMPFAESYATAIVAGATITLTSIGVLENPNSAHDPNIAIVLAIKGIELLDAIKSSSDL